MLVLLPLVALLLSGSFWLIMGRPRFLPAAAADPAPPPISVIIPARDEEQNIGGLLASIPAGDPAPCEVIVVDDGSTDATAENAEAAGARVVVAGLQPEGWVGKTWACQQGAAAAGGDWLLFLDADVRVLEGGFGRLAALAGGGAGAAYSVCPWHRVERPHEELSAFFNVTMIAGVDAFGLWPDRRRGEALFGQCLLVSRESYERAGGHRAVRGELLENFVLSRELAAAGIPCRSYLGRGALRMRMFSGGFRQLCASWMKGFVDGASGANRRALAGTVAWLSGGILATSAALLAFTPAGGASGYRLLAATAYAVFVLQCLRAFRIAGGFSRWTAVFFPVALAFYLCLFGAALVRRRLGLRIQWRGRDVA